MKKNFTYGLVFIAALLLAIGCSEVKNEKIPTQTVISVHGEGFLDPASENFHGKFIQVKNYDLSLCQQCHGMNYAGGTSGQSCLTCHSKPNGPENCTVCHGSVNAAPPKDLAGNTSPTARAVGAHQKHLASTLGKSVACSECHNVPKKLTDAGHIDSLLYAEVRFDTASIFFRANASYNAANVSCVNTYCHGNFNGGNTANVVEWTGSVQCGTCHGDETKATLEEKAFPKTGHPSTDSKHCSDCHRLTVNSSMAIINLERHINGKVD